MVQCLKFLFYTNGSKLINAVVNKVEISMICNFPFQCGQLMPIEKNPSSIEFSGIIPLR